MGNSKNLGVGLYSLADAARLLHTPRRTLSRWVEGYVQQLREGSKRHAPLISHEDQSALSFGDLIELMYVRGFRDAGVELREIRETANHFRQLWKVQYPLATRRFATDGKRLLIEQGNAWEHALSGQHEAFIDELGDQLVHIGDLTAEWRPLGKDRAVVLDPDRAFGKPIDDASGAHTYVLATALNAGQDAESIAWWYGTTADAVRDAGEFESAFRDAGCAGSGHILRSA